MKYLLLFFVFLFGTILFVCAQKIEGPVSDILWKQVVLLNHATFKDHQDLDWGCGFLINYKNGVVALTARDFTGTINTRGKMLNLKDYNSKVKSWEMYVSDDPSQFVITDTLVLKKRTEKHAFIFIYSLPVWIFSVRQTKGNIIPLEPNIQKIRNKDPLYLVGYDNDHNVMVVQCIVETPLNEKYADPEIRVKTENFLYYENFVGGPIVDKQGKVVGVINRAYQLKKDKKGRIINPDKNVEGSYYEFFVNGTSMRTILGKGYQSK